MEESHTKEQSPQAVFEWSFEQGDRKWQQDELELGFEKVGDIFWSKTDEDTTTIDKSPTIIGPITRSRAKLISDQVNANLSLPYNLDYTTMLELRYHMEEIQQPMSS